ncbi:hypothetical protein EBZ38_00180 [bacterium]|nr:hypothetical protein [bacterium]
MAISTVTKPDKKKIHQELKDYHQPLFTELGIEDPFFVTSMAYKPIGKTEKYISLFPSQMKRGVDIYTEFTNKDLKPDDPARNLYKWRFNPHWSEEYEAVEIEGSTDYRYLIPVSELILLERPSNSEVVAFNDFADIMDPDQDCPIDQMTVRDLAAILLKKPVSKKKWLNDLIK